MKFIYILRPTSPLIHDLFIYFIEFLDQPDAEKLDMGFLFYGHELPQVEGADSQVQSYNCTCNLSYIASILFANTNFTQVHT